MNARGRCRMIAVVGGSGAGKSWLVERLQRLLGEKSGHVALDDFYRDRSHLPAHRRPRFNFDAPRAIDWSSAAQAVRDCRAGLPVRIPEYDFATYRRTGGSRIQSPRPVVFVEGLWLLRRSDIRSLFDLKVFLDTPADLRRERRISRDTSERGYSAAVVRRRLSGSVLPMHDRYVEPQRRWADLVLGQPYRARDVERLAGALWDCLAANGVMPCWMHERFCSDLLSLLVDDHSRN